MFEITHNDELARAGQLQCTRGAIETPALLPIASLGVNQYLMPEDIMVAGPQTILSDVLAYKERPGVDLLRSQGGLGKFVHWQKPIMVDSGFLSNSNDNKLSMKGLEYRSCDGRKQLLTPESLAEIQQTMQSDMVVAFGGYSLQSANAKVTKDSRQLLAWAQQSRELHQGGALQFGAVPRHESEKFVGEVAAGLITLNFDGYVATHFQRPSPDLAALFPLEKPRYFSGVKNVAELVAGIKSGFDLFDTSELLTDPSYLQTANGIIDLADTALAQQDKPIEDECSCGTCQHYSIGYLHHLHQAREMLGCRLAVCHNLHFLQQLMKKCRAAITTKSFATMSEVVF